jgi:hypothetical protein
MTSHREPGHELGTTLVVDPEAAARMRLIVALEEVRGAAKALGLDVAAIGALYAPLALRVDAWCHRIERDAAAWDRISTSPLFTMPRLCRVTP